MSETIAAEYRAIISKPICLEDIQQRASRQPGYAYDELERDLRLIVSNCITFNQGTKHGEVYVQTAEEFDSEVSALMRQLGKPNNDRAVTPTGSRRPPASSQDGDASDSEEEGDEEQVISSPASDRSLVVAWSLMDSPKPTAEEDDEDGGDRGEDEEISQLTLMQSPGFMGLGLNSDSGSELNSFSATKPPPIRQQKQARQAADENEDAWRLQQQQERRAQMLRDQQQASLREMEEQEEKKAEEEKRQRDKDLTASRKPHPPSPCGTLWTESDPPEI